MNSSSIIVRQHKLTRLSLLLLALATTYGIVAGASISMYYDVTPNMGKLADSLAFIPFTLFFLAFTAGLSHLPMILADLKQRLWPQAALRAVVFFGPLIVFLGTDGLIAHFLWWSPISHPDRFHLLHHSLFAGAPLTLAFGLVVQRWWRPPELSTGPSLFAWLGSGVVLTLIIAGPVLLMGISSPVAVRAIALVGLLLFLVMWRWAG